MSIALTSPIESMSDEEYSRIFSYPNSDADREMFHREFAGVVSEDDFGRPLGYHTYTMVEASELKRMTLNLSKGRRKKRKRFDNV